MEADQQPTLANVKTTSKLPQVSATYVRHEDLRPLTSVSPKARLGQRAKPKEKRSNFALTAEQKVAARAMFKALEGTGLIPEEVVKRALEGRRAIKQLQLNEAIDLFLASRIDNRPSTLTWYASKLGIFASHFGKQFVDDVSRRDYRRWLEGQPVSESTRRAYTRAVSCLYRWLANQEPPMAGGNVAEGLMVSTTRSAEIGFLPVAEVQRILAHIQRHHLPAVVVSLFAGIRPHEVSDPQKQWLTYKSFIHDEKRIRIPGEVTKTGVPRTLEGLPDTIWAWLPRGASNEKIATTQPSEIQEKAAVAAGYGEKHAWTRKWPHDAFRHSFATYAMALTNDAPQVSHWLGHEGKPSLVYRAYAGLTTRAEAEKFFGLRPA